MPFLAQALLASSVHRPPSSLKLIAECRAATVEEIRIRDLITTFLDKMEDEGRTVYVSFP